MNDKALPWFRLYAKTVDDEKIRLLAFEDRWHFIALLCCKGAGLLDAGDSAVLLRRKLSVKLGLAPRELEALALRLAELDLIDDETFQPVSWEQLQYQSDRSTDRVRKHRERVKQQRDGVEKLSNSSSSDEKRQGNVSVTPPDTDTDTEKEQKHIAQRCALRFADFWEVYPRKVGRKPSLEKWKAKKLDATADRIIADVLNRAANDGRWLDGFIPDPRTYLAQERWTDELQPRRPLPGEKPAHVSPTTPASTPSPQRDSESRLENAIRWARQQHHAGLIDLAERDRLIAEATAKHREREDEPA